ncbi:hypothetical protein SLA2020_242730 [Shorea laevis]
MLLYCPFFLPGFRVFCFQLWNPVAYSRIYCGNCLWIGTGNLANWLKSSINPPIQRFFFMIVSPTHLWSWEWKPDSHDNFFDETYPIQEASYWGAGSGLAIMK